jgi:hypothetical protein
LLKIEKEANELVTRQHMADSGISIKENYTIIFNRGVKGITAKKKVKPMMIMLSPIQVWQPTRQNSLLKTK